MIRGDRRFLTEATRRVRAEVFASPKLAAEYRERHRWDGGRAVGRIGRSIGACLSGAVLLPLSLSFPFVFALLPELFSKTPPRSLSMEALFACQTFTMSVVVTLVTGLTILFPQPPPDSLRVALQLPVSDRALSAMIVRDRMCLSLIFFYFVGAGYLGVAWRERLPVDRFAMLILLAAAASWNLFSLCVLIGSCLRPSNVKGLTATLLAMAFYMPAMLVVHSSEAYPWLISTSMALPTSWVNGFVHWTLLCDEPFAWFFLVPVLATSVYGVWWSAQGVGVGEVHLSPLGQVRPVFTYCVANPVDVRKAGQASTNAEETPSAQTTAERVRNSELLRPPNWREGGWIERRLANRFSERERTLLEQFYGGRPPWTLSWLLLALCPVVLAMIGLEDRRQDLPTCYSPIWAFAVTMLEFELVRRRNEGPAGFSSFHGVFPIGLAETLAAVKKSFVLRIPYQLPLLVLAAIADAGTRPNSAIMAAVLCIAMVGLAATWIPLIVRMRFFPPSPSADFRPGVRWRRIMDLTLLGVVVFASLCSIFYVHWTATLACVLIAFVASRRLAPVLDAMLQSEVDFKVPTLARTVE